MGIFDRMGKVISSNVNALLDRAEDPRKSLDLTLEEMRGQIREAKKELVAGLGAEKVLRKKVDELDAEAEKWDKRAELALKTSDEALAREALVQKRRVVGERDRAEALRAEQRSAVLQMKSELDRMEAKEKELSARKGTIAAQVGEARAGGSGAGPGGAFAEFRRMEDKIDHQVATASAAREVDEALRGGGPSEAELEAKFAALEGRAPPGEPSRDPAVDAELAALKKRVRIQ